MGIQPAEATTSNEEGFDVFLTVDAEVFESRQERAERRTHGHAPATPVLFDEPVKALEKGAWVDRGHREGHCRVWSVVAAFASSPPSALSSHWTIRGHETSVVVSSTWSYDTDVLIDRTLDQRHDLGPFCRDGIRRIMALMNAAGSNNDTVASR